MASNLFWCSIVGPAGFLGCVILKAVDEKEAVTAARKFTTEKEGEIAAWPVPESPEADEEVRRWGIGKLFDPSKEKGYIKLNKMPRARKEYFNSLSARAHIECLDKTHG